MSLVSTIVNFRLMAGAVGFEPTNDGTKSRCLTTWPRPTIGILYRKYAYLSIIAVLGAKVIKAEGEFRPKPYPIARPVSQHQLATPSEP